MKTVPSLIASSTIGVAAAGLALGRPDPSTPRPISKKKRKVGQFADVNANATFHLSSRPATSSTARTSEARQFPPPLCSSPATLSPLDGPPRSSHKKFDTLDSRRGRRLSLVPNRDFPSLRNSTGDDTRRDSISSRGSWIRRLSTMPISQSSSPRSSVGPDSPSLHMSLGSEAPILSNPSDSLPHLPPNKLVKRSTSGRVVDESRSRSVSKSQIPTLRRPATSHQRTITLQQRFREQSTSSDDQIPETPLQSPIRFTPFSEFSSTQSPTTWIPFFDSHPTKLAKERQLVRPSDIDSQGVDSTSKRVLPNEIVRPTLIKPSMITLDRSPSPLYYEEDSFRIEDVVNDEAVPVNEEHVPSTVPSLAESQKRPRLSLSMHLSSPGTWIGRTRSLRAHKGNPHGTSDGKRYSSAPMSTLPGRKITSAGGTAHGHRSITDPTIFERQHSTGMSPPPPDTAPVLDSQARNRKTSPPLPPLSRLSSFNVDLARLGLSSSSSQPRRSPNYHASQSNTTPTSISSPGLMPLSSHPYYGSFNAKPNRMSEAVTLVGSETDGRGFAYGDEDEVDFQSETVFDSLRSGATGSVRSHNAAALDAMFDESPPSITGSSKNKRVSVHELMANGTFQEGSKIVEEDEGISTPIKASHTPDMKNAELENLVGKPADHDAFTSSSSFAANDFGRLSFDDEDEDEDWTRDDENQLSPPSNQLTARRISPSLRAALADVTHTGTTNGNSVPSAERPKSNLFDWSEPSTEKLDHLGNSARPRTAHAKQVADGRGGRTVGRKGPTALHIRSQSVPVVPDIVGQRENTKLTPKFGTWGLGAKGVSEEWDGDFDFDDDDDDGAANEDTDMENSLMLVPPAIQASQENVVGHVGQIREVCLLVEDLKRLRLLAREKDLLTGMSSHLWKEAEGIIALAVPDEEDPTLSPPHSPSSVAFGSEVVDKTHVDQGCHAEDLELPETPVEVLNDHGWPTGFVYDGNTVRKRSVFAPDDEIFGTGPVLSPPRNQEYLLPPPGSPRPSSTRSTSEYARSVMQNMHQTRSTSDPLLGELTHQSLNKMPFDTTSLRDLVHRASVLRSKLSDLIRKSDSSFQVPESTPKRDSSPAFTRVFTDPVPNPPSPGRSHSNNSILGSSIDSSPTRSLGQRHMHMMTVV